MTAGELIKKLQKYSPNTPIVVSDEQNRYYNRNIRVRDEVLECVYGKLQHPSFGAPTGKYVVIRRMTNET